TTSGIKEFCPKRGNAMIAALRKAHRDQMKKNCSPRYWLLKGEKDANAKRSKASEMTKIDRCPSSQRRSLMATYSKSFNERQAILIQEEKLALEKRRHDEKMALERKKHAQTLALERERLALEKQKLNQPRPGSGTTVANPGGAGPSIINRPRYFYHGGNKLSTQCFVDQQGRTANVIVKNESTKWVSVSGKWQVQYFNRIGVKMRTEDKFDHFSLTKYKQDQMTFHFAPQNATRCTAKLLK
ncbi:MAG: hypothetical protein AAF203_06150, partial [Pseudomonadota bacterium]